jgi:hypothetical protein
MRPNRRLLFVAILFSLSFYSLAQDDTLSCHLHVPDDFPKFTKQPLVIPAVGNRTECALLNQRRFNGKGRCHCTQDKINDAYPSDPIEPSSPRNRPELLP